MCFVDSFGYGALPWCNASGADNVFVHGVGSTAVNGDCAAKLATPTLQFVFK